MPATLAPPSAAQPDVPSAIGQLVLLGHPVAHSLSPRFQNAALRAAGIPLTYRAADVAPHALPGVLDALVAARAAGNVTLPHKEAVAARCDLRTPLAARVGAVNTYWCTLDGALWGDNTDVAGVDASVRQLFGGRVPAGQRVALLGAGGSAAAVLAAAESWPDARVRVWSRTRERADALTQRFPAVAHAVDALADALDRATLVVNATPLGIRPDDVLPAPPAALGTDAAVLDLVYRPGETRWVHAVRASGRRAIDGLPMLIAQGAASFVRWFGVAPDTEAMWAAVGGRPAGSS
ncbi:shikimate dehydrogenase family protein [Roseisolibacter agri]|uniref:Shikimate dehydrogenase (NADP(+)) n=1 Tax=Roseisolibacter agri TaxID=2014610 RepID=A0AA37V3Z0_9BACT|nr:shikimate dehydrogenase [Roseisolibacter agri]GLC27282.1 shikimate dehydrogenase (NADP(+)) [Roseisolibacter agri]